MEQRPSRKRPIRFTPELIAEARRRYEEGDEVGSVIAADLGMHRATLDRMVVRYGWKRRSDRRRGLPAAAPDPTSAAPPALVVASSEPPPAAPPSPLSMAWRLELAVENELRKIEL
jgi:hypothetical protein